MHWIWITAIFSALVLLYLLILWVVARIFIYPMRTPIWISPGYLGMDESLISLKTDDGMTIAGSWVNVPNPKAVVIMIHGFMMNRAELVPTAFRIQEKGYASLLLDLRAHGRSSRSKSGFGWLERAEVRAGIEESRRVHPGVPVILFGSSMGAAAIVFAVTQDETDVSGLILDGAYGDLSDAVEGWFRWLGGPIAAYLLRPIGWVARPMLGFDPYKLSVTSALSGVRVPTLFLHGENDRLAKFDGAEKNFQATYGPKILEQFEKAGHCQARWMYAERYDAAILKFLESVSKPLEYQAEP